MSRLATFLCLIAPLIGISQNAELLSNEGWKFEKSKYDVTVFGKNITGYEVKAFKVSGLIDASLDAVYRVVMDIEGYDEWYPNCKAGEVLDQPADSVQYRRIEFGLPWPFDNRESVNKLVATKSTDSIWIDVIDAYDYTEKSRNIYRVGKTEGFWIIEKENESQTRLTYSVIGEPGGIPKWIINIFLFDSPLEAVNNIREVVKRAEYAADPEP